MSELIDETGEETPYKLKDDILSEKLNEIQELSNTPIIDNLSKFILSTTSDQTVLDLLKYLQNEETLNYKDIKSFSLNNTTLESFKDAKDLLTLYRSVIVGARYDNIDLENIVGFNTTLNELSGKKENLNLAEIDGQTADLILEDINKLLSKLDYFERLHKLNNGDKYNIQDKTALNKNYIMFNKYKHFISILDKDNDWNQSKSFSELKNLILNDSPTLLENSGTDGNYANRKFSLTLEQKNEIEKESLAI
jgi:hypothetical protein